MVQPWRHCHIIKWYWRSRHETTRVALTNGFGKVIGSSESVHVLNFFHEYYFHWYPPSACQCCQKDKCLMTNLISRLSDLGSFPLSLSLRRANLCLRSPGSFSNIESLLFRSLSRDELRFLVKENTLIIRL